jgi:hypothetical protein
LADRSISDAGGQSFEFARLAPESITLHTRPKSSPVKNIFFTSVFSLEHTTARTGMHARATYPVSRETWPPRYVANIFALANNVHMSDEVGTDAPEELVVRSGKPMPYHSQWLDPSELRELTDEMKEIASLLVFGAEEPRRDLKIEPGKRLSVEEVAAVMGCRRRFVRRLLEAPLFQAEMSRLLVALRSGAKVKAVQTLIGEMDHPGDLAADSKARIDASKAVLNEGGGVNVSIDNRVQNTVGVQVRAGYVFERSSPGPARPTIAASVVKPSPDYSPGDRPETLQQNRARLMTALPQQPPIGQGLDDGAATISAFRLRRSPKFRKGTFEMSAEDRIDQLEIKVGSLAEKIEALDDARALVRLAVDAEATAARLERIAEAEAALTERERQIAERDAGLAAKASAALAEIDEKREAQSRSHQRLEKRENEVTERERAVTARENAIMLATGDDPQVNPSRTIPLGGPGSETRDNPAYVPRERRVRRALSRAASLRRGREYAETHQADEETFVETDAAVGDEIVILT